MKYNKTLLCFALLSFIFLVSCAARNPLYTKTYDGKLRDKNEVSFVTCESTLTVTSVNNKEFSTDIPLLKYVYRYIELEAPKTYTLRIWDSVRPENEKYVGWVTFDAEPGAVYAISRGNNPYKMYPVVSKIVDKRTLDTFFKQLESGAILRDNDNSNQ